MATLSRPYIVRQLNATILNEADQSGRAIQKVSISRRHRLSHNYIDVIMTKQMGQPFCSLET